MVGAAPPGCLLRGEEEAGAAGEWKSVSGPACAGQRRGKGGDPGAGEPGKTKRGGGGGGIPEPSTLRGWGGGRRLRPPLGVMAPL